MKFKKQLIETLKLNKKILKSGLQINSFGNGSIRNDDKCFIKPSGINLGLAKLSDISVVNIKNGEILSGKKPSVDLDIHLSLYKNFKDIKSIVHTHSLYATSWAQSRRPIPCYGTTHADYFPKEIPITDPINKKNLKEKYELEIGNTILIKLKKIKMKAVDIPGILILNHGVVAWGNTSKTAIENAIAIEFIAQLAFNSELINKSVKKLSSDLHKKHYNRKHGKNSYYGQK
ncbi:MAG: L-ribulose-5-phosphate 4-epimerase [Candidatus Pelagibacter sp.]|nr:L-ribulose-5-phosphate 4-epimerase [Candidatus Pelagibacter sp.]